MPGDPKDNHSLRRKAEKALAEAPEKPALTSTTEQQKLVHELAVHQIELEMQNEELRRSRQQLEESRSDYTELYDFAPVGYLTLDKAGLITRANLTVCGLLGIERGLLLKKPFALFVNPESQDPFYLHKQKVLETTTTQSCQLVLKRKDGTSFHAQLESIAVQVRGQPAVRSILTDITERKAEEALRRYESLFQNSRDIVLLMRRDGGSILEVNVAAENSYGYRRDELLKLSINDLREADTRGLTADQIAQADAGGILFETIHRRKDGSTFPVEVSSQGATVAGTRTLISVIRDITERKQAEQALRDSEARYHRLVELSPDAILVHAEGKYLYANPAGAGLFGAHSSEEIIGRDVLESIHPDHRVFMVHRIEEACAGAVTPLAEIKFMRLDGTTVDTEVTCRQVEFGSRAAIQVVVRNITERKKAEEALKESQTLLKTIVESTPDYISLKDQEGRYVMMNSAAAEILTLSTGISAAEIIGKKDDDFARPEMARRVMDEDRQVMTSGQTRAYDQSFIIANSLRVFSTVKSPYRNSAGDVVGIANISRDITLRARIEEELRKSRDELELRVHERTDELQQAYEKLKEESREREQAEARLHRAMKMEALGALAGGIAHDFNNILAAIIGFSEMTRDKVPEGSPAWRHMERVLGAGIRGRELIKQILTFSRQAEQEKQPLKLAPAVRETLKLLRASLPSTVDIRMNLQSEAGFVLADPTQIQQVLMNLCTNAAHAMRRKGGSISIDLAGFSFSSPEDAPDPAMTPGLYARLSVTDTGEGMSRDVLDRIFDPFFTTKAVGEGTGLGLSVVHGIVASHGGTITVSSEQGKGSTFTVYLPKLLEEESRGSTDADGSIPRGDERILFVDDEKDLAEIGNEMLTGLGYRVTARTGAREALALFRLDPFRFDLVITDQTMPELTGKELVEEILIIRPDTPIVMCTGFSHLVDADTAKAAGVRAFAMKPLTRAEIARTIRNVLDE